MRLRIAELQRGAERDAHTVGTTLFEREELLRDAERVAHLGTWTWDVASGQATWSDELYRILGHEPASVVPSPEAFLGQVHHEDRAMVQAEMSRSMNTGVARASAFRIVRPDGSTRHATGSSVMLYDAAGAVRRMVGGVLDRTDSLEAEAKMRRTLALLEEAQRFAHLGSWRFAPSTGELEWSQEFCRIAGLDDDVKPRVEQFFDRLVPEDRPRFEASYRAAHQSLVIPEIEGRLKRPDGTVRHVRLTAFAVDGADGRRELRGTMLDTTDQVLLREELAQSQKMEAVGRLAGGIAHDFNNMLTVILANLDLLAMRVGSSVEIDSSLQALSSAANLTRRLLAFGRKAQLSLKLVAPNVLVRSMTALMQRLVGDEVRLEIALAPDLPEVRIDPLEMERALVNLVVNARDAMPGGGAVYITTGAREVDGVLEVELMVGDEGPGIDEAVRPHIFEPFFTTRSDAGGTGLGLATVLGTAEQHGGTVRVASRAGGGTVFTIALPAAAVDDRTVAPRRPGRRADSLRPLEVLVIDDEANVAAVTRRTLEARGHTVRIATDPEEALHVWAEHGTSIDLIICDIVMAKMRGPALVERMGDVGVKPRVLFMTGYSEEAAQRALGHPVLAKPFTARELIAAIGEAIGERSD
ncbi:MAG: PAS domain-containing protein [Myxococcales bacterium]